MFRSAYRNNVKFFESYIPSSAKYQFIEVFELGKWQQELTKDTGFWTDFHNFGRICSASSGLLIH